MSTLSIVRTETVGSESDVDTRFDALVRCPVPAQRTGVLDFETVFDLDYGQLPIEVAPVLDQPTARRIRAVSVESDPVPPVVRLTRRGRLVLVLAFLAAAVALTVPLGGWATASLSGGTPEPVRIVEVAPGDTLYGIAGEASPSPARSGRWCTGSRSSTPCPAARSPRARSLAVPRG